jgi:DNA-binding MarR family transcriptional regulator
LGYLLAQVSISTNQVFKKNIVALHNLNKLEFTALILIKNNPNLTLKNLVEILNLPASNLSLLLLKLEDLKLIVRNKSTLEKRIAFKIKHC